jgi:predicted RecA/RadA family phage recombinase
MATNYVNSGDTVTLPAPTGGSEKGVPQVINDLAVMPLESGSKGTLITYRTAGAWSVPADASLKAGNAASVKDGALVAPGTEGSKPYGKLLSDSAGGYAEVLIVQ